MITIIMITTTTGTITAMAIVESVELPVDFGAVLVDLGKV
jgi:hypothetical protein